MSPFSGLFLKYSVQFPFSPSFENYGYRAWTQMYEELVGESLNNFSLNDVRGGPTNLQFLSDNPLDPSKRFPISLLCTLTRSPSHVRLSNFPKVVPPGHPPICFSLYVLVPVTWLLPCPSPHPRDKCIEACPGFRARSLLFFLSTRFHERLPFQPWSSFRLFLAA